LQFEEKTTAAILGVVEYLPQHLIEYRYWHLEIVEK
jgi:hypothetical protein